MVVRRTCPTGCVTFWTLAEWSDAARLKAGWEAVGLGRHAPALRPPVACLRDALLETMASQHVIVRPLASKTGFVVVREQRGTDENEYQALFSARIPDGESAPVFSMVTRDTARVEEAFRKGVGRLKAHQVSAALVAVMAELGGIRLRPSGGVYWLSGERVEDWARATDAVAHAADGGTSVAYCIRHELDAAAVLAVKDALVHEVTAETERLAKALLEGDLGDRAVAARKAEAARLREKVEEYEARFRTATAWAGQNFAASSGGIRRSRVRTWASSPTRRRSSSGRWKPNTSRLAASCSR
jgi:hypothetical protein